MNSQTKCDLSAWIDGLSASLKSVKQALVSHGRIYTSEIIRDTLRSVATTWFDKKDDLVKAGISEELVNPCNKWFEKMAEQSLYRSRRDSCLNTVNRLVPLLGKELTLAVMKLPASDVHIQYLGMIFSDLDIQKIPDLEAAVESVRAEQYESSLVQGWSAAMSYIHAKIVEVGFAEFNRVCLELVSASGRYKKFTNKHTVSNRASLQKISDSDILWIIEYWGMIDNNQHDRLEQLLVMRHNSAHPGDAPITPVNTLSFFSDLKEIIFLNPMEPGSRLSSADPKSPSDSAPMSH
ncbi:MAG: hypothetical protein MPL62_08370 [Alphaproteobacteria bacterium]|nr:hypothetical protein [Alphaproteobacteria bacterium]